MKNYVIINGVNSLTITGLAISKLPSISKPPLRVMTEEINGRDGDLITELGYGAYDKELVIGLYGNYDINEVIGFFNQEGTIVFSNEDDKYYNFKIINQIDYEALIKFRTATINLHCQPFKYPLTETPEEITTEYVEEEGETLTLNDTKIAPLSITPKGNTSQNGTPTPSDPIDVNVVSGDNEVVVCGKNLFDTTKYTTTANINVISNTNGTLDLQGISGYYAGLVQEFSVIPNQQYKLSYKATKIDTSSVTRTFVRVRDNDNSTNLGDNGNEGNITISFTPPHDKIFIFFSPNGAGNNGHAKFENIQLEKGSTATTYEPYTSQNYPLYLGVENLFGVQDNTITTQGITITTANNNVSFVGTATRSYVNTTTIPINLPVGTYTISATNTNYNFYVWFKDNNNAEVGATSLYKQPRTITLTGNATKIQYGVESLTTGNSYNIQTNFQIEKGSKANTYNEYGSSYIELNKIGTYQDYIYKDSGKWYLHKEVGKVVLNGSQGPWAKGSASGTTYSVFQADDWGVLLYVGSNTSIYSDKLVGGDNFTAPLTGEYIQTGVNPNAPIRVSILNSRLSEASSNGLNTYLTTNNITCYIPLKTPTEEEITNTTLINQLESLRGAMSYEGQTNISQVNNDLPFILKVKGTKEGSGEGIINNIGNIYAKPIIALEGTGNIGIYKNGTQYFEVDMSSDNEITIDTEKMEAYHNGVLKNRKVIGDYNKFTIDEGNNNIEITGELTKATISNYTRWL